MTAVWLARGAGAQEPDPLGPARALESVFVAAIARAEGAVVAISRDDAAPALVAADPFDPFGPARQNPGNELPFGDYTPEQFGSGVIVAHPQQLHERYVLTTCHVVFGDGPPVPGGAVRVTLRLPQRGTVTVNGTPHAADRRIDLAVLRLNLDEVRIPPEEIPALPIGDAESIRKGRLVIALGNPYAMARDGSSSASIGIVSNVARRPQPPARDVATRDSASIHEYGTLLTVDTRLQMGASGGALLNLDGALIGITTALAALQGYEKSAGYAIPFDAGTRRIIGDMLNGYEAEYGFLGISPEPFRWTDVEGRPVATVRAAHVAQQSPADQAESPTGEAAGLRTGDLILQINGQPVHDVADLMRIIGLLGPSAETQLLVRRGAGNETETIIARLGKWPVYDDRDILSTAVRSPAWRGLLVDYPTARQRYLSSDRLEQYRQAVVVTRVEEGSAAAAAGLKSGDFITAVDGLRIQTPAEFAAATGAAQGAVQLTLWEGAPVQINP